VHHGGGRAIPALPHASCLTNWVSLGRIPWQFPVAGAMHGLRGEPDPDRLRRAILSTARAHPKLMTTLCGGSLWLCRGLHEEFVGEVLGVSYLSDPQAQLGLVGAGIGKHPQMPTGSRIEISQLSRNSKLLY
jgi:hypothetical protein